MAVQALRGISMDIRQGEILALVGESGSGKTVLSLSVLGLLPRRDVTVAGAVTVAGIDMIHDGHRTLRNVRRHLLGAVFQDPLTSLNPSMLIIKQLTERGIPAEEALENLREAGIADAEHRARQFPHQLSGGLRQRAMIGMALGADGSMPSSAGTHTVNDSHGAPKLIVADEPTTALDVSVQAQILALFDRLRRQHNCAIMLVTHDIGVAAAVADRVAVLFAGTLCEIGPAQQVISSPQHPYTEMLLRSRLTLQKHACNEPLAAADATATPAETGCPYAPRCTRATEECKQGPIELRHVAREPAEWLAACLHPISFPAEDPAEIRDVHARQMADAQKPEKSPPATRGGWALELNHVRKTFQMRGARGVSTQIVAVDDCSLRVPCGGSVALVGESGSGKTTTLRIATGLTRPDSGSVRWDEPERRPQLIFQDAASSLTPWLTVDQHLSERLQQRGIARRERRPRIQQLRGLVGLDEAAGYSRPLQLSGGQQQRAAIARALASEPSLLICDEPVSALDASLAARILRLLDDLRRRLGVALLTVTHDLAVARFIADEVYVMYRGHILEIGPSGTIFDQPKHPYTQGLLGAAPGTKPGQLAPSLRGDPPSPFEHYNGCPFENRCPHAQLKCKAERPPLRILPSGAAVACHFASDDGMSLPEESIEG
jgi:peptide/nickel transport system ATP-binding protein